MVSFSRNLKGVVCPLLWCTSICFIKICQTIFIIQQKRGVNMPPPPAPRLRGSCIMPVLQLRPLLQEPKSVPKPAQLVSQPKGFPVFIRSRDNCHRSSLAQPRSACRWMNAGIRPWDLGTKFVVSENCLMKSKWLEATAYHCRTEKINLINEAYSLLSVCFWKINR